MKNRFILITVAGLLLLGAFLGIMTRLHSPEEVLAPPNPNGEHRQLQQAFEDAVGNGTEYKLQYPDEGEYKSAYVLYDVDGDEDQEALVFYTKNSEDSNVRVNVLDLRDGKWTSVLDESGYGNKVDSVAFSDLNGDGTSEVILSWSLQGAEGSRTMTVHTATLPESGKPELKTLANMPYKAMSLYDMDNDGNNEILVLWTETVKKVQRNYAALMKLTASGLKQYGEEAVLDNSTSLYDQILFQEGKTPMAFVDAMKGDNTMVTEVLWWDGVNQTLRAPFTENKTNTNLNTLRTPAVPTLDIDEDGLLEIPVAYDFQSSSSDTDTAKQRNEKNAEKEETLYLSRWSNTGTADPGVLQEKAYSLADAENRYMLRIGSGYRDSLFVTRNTKTNVITVYALTETGSKGEPLFSLSYSGTGKPDEKDTYTFLAQKDNRTVFGTLTSAGKAEGFTNENIEDSIVFY